MNYWLLKTEGSCYSIDDLRRDKKTQWGGVRNYQARNFMNDMRVGDLILFYHSSGEANGVYGIAKVSKKAYPDETQFDKKDEHFDPKATHEKPIWFCPEVTFVEKFKEPVLLSRMKIDSAFTGMLLLKRGSRLSVQPVSKRHFEHLQKISRIL